MKNRSHRIEAQVPEDMLDALTHSEIFKQTYYVADRNWVEEEDERFRPVRILTLEDEREVTAWMSVEREMKSIQINIIRE